MFSSVISALGVSSLFGINVSAGPEDMNLSNVAKGTPMCVLAGCQPKTIVLRMDQPRNPDRPGERTGRGLDVRVARALTNDQRRKRMGRSHGPYGPPVKEKYK